MTQHTQGFRCHIQDPLEPIHTPLFVKYQATDLTCAHSLTAIEKEAKIWWGRVSRSCQVPHHRAQKAFKLTVLCSHVSFLSSKQPQSSRPENVTVNPEYNLSQFPPTTYQLIKPPPAKFWSSIMDFKAKWASMQSFKQEEDGLYSLSFSLPEMSSVSNWWRCSVRSPASRHL